MWFAGPWSPQNADQSRPAGRYYTGEAPVTNSFCLRFAGTLLPRRAAWPADNDSSRTAGNHRQRLRAKAERRSHIEGERERERGGVLGSLIGYGALLH